MRTVAQRVKEATRAYFNSAVMRASTTRGQQQQGTNDTAKDESTNPGLQYGRF
jgi:hypothetical protein